MQALAREFDFAETTFVLPPADGRHTRRVRIFTPRVELPFAGHPTLGTAAALVRAGVVAVPPRGTTVVLEEGIGPVPVEVRREGEAIFGRFALERPVDRGSGRPPGRAEAAAALSLPEEAVREVWFAGVGVPFCFVHLASGEAVDRARLDRGAWAAAFASAWAGQLYPFAGDLAPGGRLHARMFAPAFGIEEDPASGSAGAALAGCLAERRPEADGAFGWTIAQGVAMGRPSEMEIAADKRQGRVVRISVGGFSVAVGEGRVTAPAVL